MKGNSRFVVVLNLCKKKKRKEELIKSRIFFHVLNIVNYYSDKFINLLLLFFFKFIYIYVLKIFFIFNCRCQKKKTKKKELIYPTLTIPRIGYNAFLHLFYKDSCTTLDNTRHDNLKIYRFSKSKI